MPEVWALIIGMVAADEGDKVLRIRGHVPVSSQSFVRVGGRGCRGSIRIIDRENLRLRNLRWADKRDSVCLSLSINRIDAIHGALASNRQLPLRCDAFLMLGEFECLLVGLRVFLEDVIGNLLVQDSFREVPDDVRVVHRGVRLGNILKLTQVPVEGQDGLGRFLHTLPVLTNCEPATGFGDESES